VIEISTIKSVGIIFAADTLEINYKLIKDV